jgi:5-methylcytosine-specific restriction protein B
LLRAINDRLEFLIDRDHRIGHAYFMKVNSLEDLRRSFERQIIPLLQEYFFDDWGRVALVLSTGSGRSAFVRADVLDGARLFGAVPDGSDSERTRHEVTPSAGWTADAFRAVYEKQEASAASAQPEVDETSP